MECQEYVDCIPQSEDSKQIRSSKTEGKYGLRPRTLIKRLQQEKLRQQDVPKKSVRSKPRPAPLSKYRRKTANARERHRMREINNAFESLRKALPDAFETQTQNTNTKITTLRHAVQYIQALSQVLEDETKQEPYYSNGHENNPSYHIQKCEQALSLPISSHSRSSLSSSSDLEELLSDESGLLEDNNVFSDISSLTGSDAFEILLNQERENLLFTTDFCTLK